jgi:hypothetical protein
MSGPKTKEDFARQSLEAKRRAAERLAADIAKSEAALTGQAQPVPPKQDPAALERGRRDGERQAKREAKFKKQSDEARAETQRIEAELAERKAALAAEPRDDPEVIRKLQLQIEAAKRGKVLFHRSDRRSGWSVEDQARLDAAIKDGSAEWAD